MRMKAYVYLSDNFTGFTETGTAAYINGFLYDSELYTLFGNVSIVDTNFAEPELPITNDPYLNGSVGLLAGPNQGSISVDWIRVLKTTPGFQPIVQIGAWECNNWRWNKDLDAESVATDSFTPGPLLQDFHSSVASAEFVINQLPQDTYRFTVMVGKIDDSCDSFTIQFTESSGETASMVIPGTEAGMFTKQSLLFEKSQSDSTISISSSDQNWMINELRIEKGYQGILIEEVYI